MSIKIRTHTNQEIELYKASYALIVGNGKYTHWDSLPGALQDVKEVKDVLVVCQPSVEGYSLLSLMRASSVVNRHLTVARC